MRGPAVSVSASRVLNSAQQQARSERGAHHRGASSTTSTEIRVFVMWCNYFRGFSGDPTQPIRSRPCKSIAFLFAYPRAPKETKYHHSGCVMQTTVVDFLVWVLLGLFFVWRKVGTSRFASSILTATGSTLALHFCPTSLVRRQPPPVIAMAPDLRRRGAVASDADPPEDSAAPAAAAPSTPDKKNPRAKIDKSGLYDLAQVKRLLDDEVIAVRPHSCLPPSAIFVQCSYVSEPLF